MYRGRGKASERISINLVIGRACSGTRVTATIRPDVHTDSYSTCGRFLLNSYSKMMQYPILAVLPPPVVVSYWLPIQIWCNILSWLPCLLWSFLIEFLFKYYAISSPGCLASSLGGFVFNSFSNMMQYPPLVALHPPVVVSYWILIQIWCNILSWLPYLPPPLVVSYWIPFQIWCNILPLLPCILLWSFLIESLFKYDAISSLGCLASSCGRFFIEFLFKYDAISSHGGLTSSCGRFLLKSYSNIMQYPLLAASHPPVFDSYWIPIHARQPGEDIASHLNVYSMKNNHKGRQGNQ